MSYAGLVRPVIDRVYMGARIAARPRIRAVYDRVGFDPGYEQSLYFGLLARPMSAAALAAATVYSGGVLAPGVATVDADGNRTLTELGREVALAVQDAIGATAEELWSARPIETMPGLASLDRLYELTGRLLEAGTTTGGPSFGAMAPPFEPEGASAALLLVSRLGALRHHRGDAHRAAWAAAGLSADEVKELAEGPVREAVEEETNRRDEPVYAVLSESERLEFLAGLGALPDGLGR